MPNPEDEMNISDINIQNLGDSGSYTETNEDVGNLNPVAYTDVQKELLTTHNGVDFTDDNKFMVDSSGKQVAELDATGAWKKIEVVEAADPIDLNTDVDDVNDNEDQEEAIINEVGDIVDRSGKVLHKKGEFEVDAEGNVTIPSNEDVVILQKMLKDDLGVELVDSEGIALTYENSHAGIAKMVDDASTLKAQQSEDVTFAKHPKAKAFLNHLIAGGDESNFFNVPTTFRNIKIGEETADNKANMKSLYRDLIISEFRQRNDYDNQSKAQKTVIDKQASSYYEYTESAGTDRDTAINAQKILSGAETAMEQRRDADNAATIAEYEATDKAFWGGIKESVVTNGEIGNFKIPKDVRQGFYEYMHDPIDKFGNTQEMIDGAKNDEENITLNVKLALMRYLKFDLSKLVAMEIADKKAKDLRLGSKRNRGLKIVGGLPVDKATTDLDGITIGKLTLPKQ